MKPFCDLFVIHLDLETYGRELLPTVHYYTKHCKIMPFGASKPRQLKTPYGMKRSIITLQTYLRENSCPPAGFNMATTLWEPNPQYFAIDKGSNRHPY